MAADLTTLWPELLVNAVGVLLGGIGALAVGLWRLRRRAAAERSRTRAHVASSLEWLWFELQENEELVVELQRVLARGSTARMDLLRWAGRIAEALAFEAQADLIRSGYHRQLSSDAERAILKTYHVLTALRNMLRQAEPAVDFYVNCCGEEGSAQKLVQELHGQTDLARSEVSATRQRLRELGHEFGRTFSMEDATHSVTA